MSKFIFLLFTAFISISAQAVSDYPFRESIIEKRIRATWDESYFSDPAQHNATQFMYMIHKLNLENPQHTELLLENPKSLENKFRICTSVISQKLMGLYKGSIGFIIKAPAVNIGPMNYQDMASRFADDYPGALSQFRILKKRFNNFYTPASLIEDTRSQGGVNYYNEVDILGSNLSTNTHIKVLGILIECGDSRDYLKKSALLHSEQVAAVIDRCVEEENYRVLLKELIGKLPFLVFDNL